MAQVEGKVESHFASAERASQAELAAEIASVVRNPVVQELLVSINGLIAVLDRHRQAVAINSAFLGLLGIDDPGQVLGLRLGEALCCVHAAEEPAGCGTTRFCSTCGAAVATVAALAGERPVERICALTAERGECRSDMAFLVRAHPISVDTGSFILLFLQDITVEQQRAALERTFFHDVGNMLTGLLGASEMLASQHTGSQLAQVVRLSARRLCREVDIQNCILKNDVLGYRINREETTTAQLLDELGNVFYRHPAALDKRLVSEDAAPVMAVFTDISLALRVMCNMVTNALEATADHGCVRIWFEPDRGAPVFCVWNAGGIPGEVQLRVFQRNFSTKTEAGRGLGTFSMQLLGEKLLGGKVSFSSSDGEGTVFRFKLPSYRN